MSRARAAIGVAVLAVLAVLWFSGRDRGTRRDSPGPERATGSSVGAGRDPGAGEARRSGLESDGSIVGRVLDQFGDPWIGLSIRGGGEEARTGPEGGFELLGLERTELLLDLSADFDPKEPLGERHLASAVPPVPVDLRGPDGRADVGTQIVPRSRPFWVEGRVELDEALAQARALGLGDVRLELVVPTPEELGHLLQPEITPLPGAGIDWTRPPWRNQLPAVPALAPDGSFRFGVESPHDPFLLRIALRRSEPIERLIVPVPGGRFAETFRLP